MASPGSGGSGGVGGPPRSGVDILNSMFEAQQAKPTDAQQQAANLRQQTQTQEQTREAPQHTEGRPAEGTPREGDSGSADRARGREVGEGLVRETEMDGFLARSSSQQQARDAGRTLTRPQTLSSIPAQGWSVANSPNTPESARTQIQQRQQQQQANGGSGPNPQAGARGNPAGNGSTLPRTLPTLPRTPMGGEEHVAPLIINYAMAYSSGGETAARPFANRAFNPGGFLQQVQRLIMNQLGGAAGQQFLNSQVPVAVMVRGNLVFVKDGKEFRAFRMNDDGSLTEMPSEDGGDHPLSPEAQAMMNKVIRQRGMHARKEGGSLKETDHLKSETEGFQEARARAEEGGGEGQLDFETRFALLLHEVLEEGKDLEKSLNGGEPSFPAKSDWEAFFGRMMKMGNQEKGAKKSMEAVLATIFRGLFKKEGQGNVLVGDLKYLQDEKTKEEKFTQVAIDNELLLKLLAQLRPGQKISAKDLKAAFGDEINYTELAHIAEQLKHTQAEECAKNVTFNAKGNIDPFSQARLERSIFGNRKAAPSLSTASEGESAALLLPPPPPAGFPANIYELMGLRERFRGSPRLYTFILYSLFLAILGIGAGIFWLKNL
ncbi:MAG: hypothetical protein K8R69_03905 [Deltaproteobacteria bacterium]|nr:hypothetical protein [Deltaproteobacteria bacterium]